jgi:hemolysin III
MKGDALLAKPLLRGWSHAAAALVAIAGLVALIVITRYDTAKLVSMIVYGTALVLLFGVSATYHIINWPPRAKNWLRRADHATILFSLRRPTRRSSSTCWTAGGA